MAKRSTPGTSKGRAKKRATTKRATAKRATAKRATAKRPAAKRATAKRATAKRAAAKRAPTPAGPRPLTEVTLEHLVTAPLDTLTVPRLTPADVARGREPGPPTLASPPLATIAPRGVFLPERVVVDVEGDTFPRVRLDPHGRDEGMLPDELFAQLQHKAAAGQRLLGEDLVAAFGEFRAALEQVPVPVENWNAAGWLLVAMGECAILAGDFARAFPPLRDAMHCPGTIGNPWVHLRIGQCRLELGDARAADDLARAYMGGGRALFEGLDPRYFAVVERVLQPPPGHDRLP